jgi:hypothetical protein
MPKREVPQPQKSPAELKDILRGMTKKITEDKEHKESKNQQDLKGALAGVIQRGELPPPPKREEIAPMPQEKELEPPKEKNKPYEVAEETLRKVLSGEDG